MNFFANVFICLIYIILLCLILHILFEFIKLIVYFYDYMVSCNINYFINKILCCNRKKNTKIIPIEVEEIDKYLLVYDPCGNIYLGTVSKD